MELQVVVHFTASWCIPSVAMNPCFEELASNYPDALFLSVDVDDVKVRDPLYFREGKGKGNHLCYDLLIKSGWGSSGGCG